MTRDTTTLDRLRAIVEAYGADPARWPAAERAAGEALLAGSAAARALVAAAADLDAALDSLPALQPTPAMRAAILAAAPRPTAPSLPVRLREGWRELFAELGGWRMSGTVLAASLVLGIASGGLLSEGLSSSETSPDLLQLAYLDDSDAEY
jgi:anti-sigma-K factor RskA